MAPVRPKIKILYTIPNFDTAGSGKVVYDLVKNLDRSLFEPEICCFHTRGAFMKEIEKLSVKVHVFKFAIPYRPFISFPFRLLKIVRFFKKHQFDLIHSWHWSSDFSEPLAAKLAGIPWIYTKKSMGWGNKAWKWRSALSSKIITINADMKKFFNPRTTAKIVEIPLGVDIDYYSPKFRDGLEAVEGNTAEKEDFMVLSVVNLIPVKGIEILIQAFKEWNHPKSKLCIVGNKEGSYAEGLIALAEGNPSISFLGKKTDVRPYHAGADVFVIPTLALGEGLPVAPLEAMASGTIVIGSKVSGVKDILMPFPQCMFEPNSVADLKKTLLYLYEMTQEERKALAQEMRIHVEREFSLKQCIERHAALYQNIIH